LEALVVEGEPGGGDDCVTSSGWSLSDSSWMSAATRDPESLTVVATRPEPSAGSESVFAVGVDERVVAQPVADRERGIAERAGERFTRQRDGPAGIGSLSRKSRHVAVQLPPRSATAGRRSSS
jgi:hypothetical protein